ncbi:MAG: beta galactosidase jelly roll domain-containing protein, partial [Ignavibacteriales bacterium]|nr:beta galactosidase jelly roll domain-containing protein [Ignavibacteriales bacterium]
RIMIRHRIARTIFQLLVGLSIGAAQSQDLREVHSLRGMWRFELGDNARWSDPSYNDVKWDDIYVPSPWEEEGYPGYDGYAWYRKHFTMESRYRDEPLYLCLGNIDDVGEIYLNGHMIGFVGKFPPDFYTGVGISFQCPVPNDFLMYGSDNVIAVRVYDYHQAGGIVRGNVGIYEPKDYLEPDFDLSGKWKFNTGDDEAWSGTSFDDSKWEEIKVPLFWEAQGHRNYDGFAWYRMKFKVPARLVGKRIMLLLGRIDDADEVYLNGELIGRTGNMRRPLGRANLTAEWQQLRAYVLPPSLLVTDQENTIAVRVLDVWQHGGIYDGPIGLIQKDRYLTWKDHPRSFWEFLRNTFR